MSRIETTFNKLDRPALITFIMAGDPDYATSLAVLKSMPDAGADIIEIGMPFTDPAADGATIQASGLRALEGGANMKDTLKLVRDFRAGNTDTPIVLMGYFNPLMAYGLEKFVNDASDTGVDGLIIVDLPPEEDQELRALTTQKEIDIIRLITPTTDEKRLPSVLEGASGFLYYVSITGVTGAAKADLGAIKPHIEEIKKHTDLPLAIGFGIKTPEDVAAMSALADGVVVGSAIINTIANDVKDADPAPITTQVSALASGLKS